MFNKLKIYRMMKKITFFLLLLAAGVASMAAATYEYTPLVREGVEWKYRVVNTCRENAEGNGSLQFTHKMQLKGDTLIAGKSYKKCYVYLNCLLDPYKESPVAYLREDGKKVYAVFKLNANKHHYATNGGTVNNDLSAELLLYDFNISKAGEKIAGSVLSFPNEYCTVQKVDSIEIGGKLRKRIITDGIGGTGIVKSSQFTIIEGIGGYGNGDLIAPFVREIAGCQEMEDLMYVGNLATKTVEYSPEGITAMDDCGSYEYTPLVREGAEWKYTDTYTCIENETHTGSLELFHKIQLKGDTIMGGTTYKKCYVYSTCALDAAKTYPIAYLREEGKKVYVVWKKDIENYPSFKCDVSPELKMVAGASVIPEKMLYNFNMVKGDTISLTREYGNYTVQVVSIDSIEIGGKLRKRMHLGPCIQGEATIPIHTVIEGIGNVFYDDFLNPCPMITTCQCIRDVNLQYIANLTTKSIEYSPNSVVTMDDCTHEGVAQVSGEGGISVSQSGNSLMVAIGASGMHTIDVLSAAGSVVASRYTTTASTIAIPTAGWASGVYIVSIASPTHRFTQKILKK
jgi:hypothetical protein